MSQNQIPDKEIFSPRWKGCAGIFNPTDELESKDNEYLHYQKHVLTGELGEIISINDYRKKATGHLNGLNPDEIVEFCQADDKAVVKFNLSTGEIGVARRDKGTIKTFFLVKDFQYIINKLEKGDWGDPEIAEGFIEEDVETTFDDDPEKSFLYDRLSCLATELPIRADKILLSYIDSGNLDPEDLVVIIGQLAECQFVNYEIEQRILSQEQEKTIFALKKKFLKSEVTLEALERSNIMGVSQTIRNGINKVIELQEEFWAQAEKLVTDKDDLAIALSERDRVQFMMMGLKILRMHGRMKNVNLQPFEFRLRKSDINLQRNLYPLVVKLKFQNDTLVSPENFRWRKL